MEAEIILIEEVDKEAMPGDILVNKEIPEIITKYRGVEKLPVDSWTPCHMNIVVNGGETIASTSRKLTLPRPSNGFLDKFFKSQGMIKKVSVEFEGDKPKINKNNTLTIRKLD